MPFLRPLGSRAPASASMNLQGATYGQQPDEPGEILTFGIPERRSLLLPGGIRRPAIATVAAGIVIRGLALAVTLFVLTHDATFHVPVTARTQRPPAIDVLIASAVSFPLTGTPGALLQVQYLQAGARASGHLGDPGGERTATRHLLHRYGRRLRQRPSPHARLGILVPRPAHGHADPAPEQPARLSADGNLDQGHQRARHQPWRALTGHS